MSNHPINLVVRFIVELLLLAITGYWGWHGHMAFSGPAIGIALPIAAAIVWGVFRVEGDPGKSRVPIPGWLRLLYELTLFTAATLMLYDLDMTTYAVLFGSAWTVHYALSYDRLLKLLKR